MMSAPRQDNRRDDVDDDDDDVPEGAGAAAGAAGWRVRRREARVPAEAMPPIRTPKLRDVTRAAILRWREEMEEYRLKVANYDATPARLHVCVEPRLLRSAMRYWLPALFPTEAFDATRPETLEDRHIVVWLERLATPDPSVTVVPSLQEIEKALKDAVVWRVAGGDHLARVTVFLAAFDQVVYEKGWSKWFEGEHEKLAVRCLTRLLSPPEFRERVQAHVTRDRVKTLAALRDVLVSLQGLLEGLSASRGGAGGKPGAAREADAGAKFAPRRAEDRRGGLQVAPWRRGPGVTAGVPAGGGGGASGAGAGPFSGRPANARRGRRGRRRGREGADPDRSAPRAPHVGHTHQRGAPERPAAARGGRLQDSTPATARQAPTGGCLICRGPHWMRDCPSRTAAGEGARRRGNAWMARERLGEGGQADGSFIFKAAETAGSPFVVDTGSDRSYVSEAWLRRVEEHPKRDCFPLEARPLTHRFSVFLASGDRRVEITAAVRFACWVRLPGVEREYALTGVDMFVMPDAQFCFLIGRDLIEDPTQRNWVKHTLRNVAEGRRSGSGDIPPLFRPSRPTPPIQTEPGNARARAAAGAAQTLRSAPCVAAARKRERSVASDNATPRKVQEVKRVRAIISENAPVTASVRPDSCDGGGDSRNPEPERSRGHETSDDEDDDASDDDEEVSVVVDVMTDGANAADDSASVVVDVEAADSEPEDDDASDSDADDASVVVDVVGTPSDEWELHAVSAGPLFDADELASALGEFEELPLELNDVPPDDAAMVRAVIGDRLPTPPLEESDDEGDAGYAEEGMHARDAYLSRGETEIEIGEEDDGELREALAALVRGAADAGATGPQLRQLKRVIEKHPDVWRVRLRGDPPARVTPLKLVLKDGVEPYRAKARPVTPLTHAFLKAFVKQLLRFGLVRRNTNSRWGSPVNPVPRPKAKPTDPPLEQMRFVVDLRPVNGRTVPLVYPMPHLDSLTRSLRGARWFASIDLFNGYWQAPLDEASQEIHSFVTPDGVFTPTRVIQGCADGTQAFQAMMTEALGDLIETKCLVWLDDVLIYGRTVSELLENLDAVLAAIDSVGFKCSAKKCVLLQSQVRWCGKLITGDGIMHDPERVSALTRMPTPVTAADALQFLAALNWMRLSIPEFARVTAPLYEIVEAAQKQSIEDAKKKGKNGKRARSKVALKRYKLSDFGWGAAHDAALQNAKQALARIVPLAYPDDGKELCLFTDASVEGWAAVLTQVSKDELRKPPQEMAHEPLAFMGSQFKGAEKKWSIVEKEAFAIVTACMRLDYLVKRPQGFRIFTDHRNLKYIFDPDGKSDLARHTAAKIARWAYILSGFRYTIEHVPGEANVWADLLTRWGGTAEEPREAVRVISTRATHATRRGEVPADVDDDSEPEERPDADADNDGDLAVDNALPPERQVRRVDALTAPPYADEEDGLQPARVLELATRDLPTREEIAAAQELSLGEGRAPDVPLTSTAEDGIRMDKDNRVWVPDVDGLRLRICIVAHQGIAGHRGMTTTKKAIMKRFTWKRITRDIEEFVRKCIHCQTSTGGTRVPRPWAEALHATEKNQVLHFDFMLIDRKESRKHRERAERKRDGDEDGRAPLHASRMEYLLVLKDDFTDFTWLFPTPDASAAGVVDALLYWCSLFGKPETFVTDQGSHFLNHVVAELESVLEVPHHFTVAYAPWSNGTVERVNKEVNRMLRALSSEWKVNVEDWPTMIPTVNSVLNMTPSARLGGYTPAQAFIGATPKHPLDAVLARKRTGRGSQVTARKVEPRTAAALAKDLALSLEKMHKHIARHERLHGRRGRAADGDKRRVRDVNFAVGQYVLVARIENARVSKLQGIWRGPMRITEVKGKLVFEVEDLVTNERMTVHAERMRLYSDRHLEMSVALKELIAFQEGAYQVAEVLDVRKLPRARGGEKFECLVRWAGFEEDADSWEPLRDILSAAASKVKARVSALPAGRTRAELLDHVQAQLSGLW